MGKGTPLNEIVGKTFGFLFILEDLGRLPVGNTKTKYVRARCRCGKETVLIFNNVKRGLVKSCGCFRVEITRKRLLTHNKSNSRLYRIHRHMLNRCANPNLKRYGGRGISVCKEWMKFEVFYNWAINNGYQDELSLDRYPDRNGNYCPENCRWATSMQQQRNRDFTLLVTYFGQPKPLADLAIEHGINYGTLKSRIFRSKWPVEKAVHTPVVSNLVKP